MPGDEEQPSIGSVLHCALLLLGYKSSSYEVVAGPNMFDKSNPKGIEALLHFLLTRLRGSVQAKKACSSCNMALCFGRPLHCSSAVHANIAGLQGLVAHQRHKTTKRLPQGDRQSITMYHCLLA